MHERKARLLLSWCFKSGHCALPTSRFGDYCLTQLRAADSITVSARTAIVHRAAIPRHSHQLPGLSQNTMDEELLQFVRDHTNHFDASHDINHAIAVYQNAMLIAKEELPDYDDDILQYACLLCTTSATINTQILCQ